jgi:hypothetical protein
MRIHRLLALRDFAQRRLEIFVIRHRAKRICAEKRVRRHHFSPRYVKRI